MRDTYFLYAFELLDMGENAESARYYQKAPEKAERTGKVSLIANALYWNGVSAHEDQAENQ